jgi:RNA polymerase sigma-70 factor (ECF subfamily)
MAVSAEDQVLMELWRAGDEEAARRLYDCYVERLLTLARRRISHRLNSRLDPEDVVQSVFRTFFERVREGRFHVEEKDDLCKLLVRITVHKTLRKIAVHTAAKRDLNLELGQGKEAQERIQELLDREPSPEETAAFLDQLEHFFSSLRPQERQILEMRMQGYNNDEIAAKLGIKHDRTIRRVIERVRGLVKREELGP